MEIEIKYTEPGICPVCEAMALEYTDQEGRDDYMDLELTWSCNNCGAIGVEGYRMTFMEHFDVVPDEKLYLKMQRKQKLEKIEKI